MGEKSDNYNYKGERYGKVNVTLSESIAADPGKSARAKQINLERRVKEKLASVGAFDGSSNNQLDIVVSNLRVRSSFNAIMFGFMSGSDSLDGTVTVKNDSETNNFTFDISASYALGGYAGGHDEARLGWLGDKFAELAANTIVNKKAK